MRKYTGVWSEKESFDFAALGVAAEEKARASSRTVLKTYANNEIRVSWVPGQAAMPSVASRPAPALDFESAERLLVYSHKAQSLTTSEGEGTPRSRSHSLSRYGCHTIREGCAVLEQAYGRKVAFVTLTHPGSTPDALEAMAEHSKGILDALLQRVRDTARRSFAHLLEVDAAAGGVHYVGVWEYQKRGALHIHLAIGIQDADMYRKIKREMQKWWRQVLETWSDKIGVDLFAQSGGGTHRGVEWLPRVECVRVKKAVGRYMSKYITKGARQQAVVEDFQPPNRWWFISRPLMMRVRAAREVVAVRAKTRHECEQKMLKLATVGQDLAVKTFATISPLTGKTVGYVMYFDPDVKSTVWDMLVSLLRDDEDRHVLSQVPWQTHGPPDAFGEIYVV